ncbi:MAG TPA: hypothetical protein VIX86_06865 [Streptosporangiaceae bacterium]
MKTAVIGAAIIIGVACYLLARLGRWARSTWWVSRLWRWLSGEAHHGKPVTDAGWVRSGSRALTPTGHATRWWHRPRWQRAAHRTGGTLGVIGLVAAFLAAPGVTSALILFTLFTCVALGFWLGWRRLRERKNRRTYLHPLHLAAHERAGIPRAAPASSWLDVETGIDGTVKTVRIYPPQGWPADAKDREWLVATASAKLGIESPKVETALAGPRPVLTLSRSEPPPKHVRFASVLDAMAACRDDELLIGIGKEGQLVKASLATDSPHIAVSMGTGAGKSNLAGWILLQVLLKGGVGLVLDAKKGASYPWILKDEDGGWAQLPNVGYARSVYQLHEGMAWLSAELDRRNDVAVAGMDTRGKVHGSVGPRLFVIAEELNMAEDRLRSYWSELRGAGDPARSPAFSGLGDVAFAGRQVRMHLVLIGQMLTAAVTGRRDSSVKENCGIKMLARYGPKGWRMMAEDVPMPPSPEQLGRVQVVTGRRVRETQTPEHDPVEARRMVLGSDVAKLPPGMPRCLMAHVTPPALAGGGFSPAAETVSAPAPGTGPVGLREAVASGRLLAGTTLGSLRMMRFRDRDGFPRPAGRRGSEDLYDLAALADYDEARR